MEELKKAIPGIAFFAPRSFHGTSQWQAEFHGQKLVVNRKSRLKAEQPGFYAFQAHATIGRLSFVNLTKGEKGVATEEPLPETVETKFRLVHNVPVGTAQVHGSTLPIVTVGDVVPNDWCTTWIVKPTSLGETDKGVCLIGEVAAEVISEAAARRRTTKGRVVKHPVIVRGTESAAVAAEVSATA